MHDKCKSRLLPNGNPFTTDPQEDEHSVVIPGTRDLYDTTKWVRTYLDRRFSCGEVPVTGGV